MCHDLPMLTSLTALLLASQAPAHATSWVFATVGHSEWCPAGNVRLDLATGRYAFTARAPRRTCHADGLERPVATGRLRAERLAAIRSAAGRAWADGLVDPSCRNGGRSRNIVISNGGTPVLVLTNGAETVSAPGDLSCWSDAAHAMQSWLDETFVSPDGR